MRYFTYILIFLFALATSWYFATSKPSTSTPIGALKLSNGKVIAIANTDDNTGEDIIIKSDKASYDTVGTSEVYLSISAGKPDENLLVQFLFPDDGSKIEKVETCPTASCGRVKNGDNWQALEVSADALNYEHKKPVPDIYQPIGHISLISPKRSTSPIEPSYIRLTISYPAETVGEFWVEAFGDKGSYGLLY